MEQSGPRTLVDVNKIRESLAENGFGVISGMDGLNDDTATPSSENNPNVSNMGRNGSKNISAIVPDNEDVVSFNFTFVFYIKKTSN